MPVVKGFAPGARLSVNLKILPPSRVRRLLAEAKKTRILVVGDVMLDQFVWGEVSRISPEGPVPVVDFQRESFMPGGAGNVARNLTALNVATDIFGVLGQDAAGRQLERLLADNQIGCSGLLRHRLRLTSVKTRVVAQKQQVVRIDRESRAELTPEVSRRLIALVQAAIKGASAVIVTDYGKGVVTQDLLNALKSVCRKQGVWLSVDPKPVHQLNLSGLSLITPNRKEAFELANLPDVTRHSNPMLDQGLRQAAEALLERFRPALLLITLGELGMLLCERGQQPFHIPTLAQEVFDVSGAGDTVIAFFTAAIAAGASALEAAMFSNHAAGIVVGKVGTATVTAEELLANLKR